MLLIPLGEALGPTPLLLLCVDRNCLRVLVDSQSQQGTLSTPPQPLPPYHIGVGKASVSLMLMLFLKPSFLSCLAFDPSLVGTGWVN